MKLKFIIIFFLFISTSIFSQDWEIGSILAYERTTFNFPDDNTIIIGGPGGRASDDLGRESNFSFGAYAVKYPTELAFYGAELFYGRHTAARAPGIAVDGISFIPHFGLDFFDIGIFLGGGIGVGYILNVDGIDETADDGFGNSPDTQRIDIPIRASISYRIKNVLTIEAGVRSSLTSFEKQEELKRNSFFAGVRVPLNQFFSK